MVARIALLSLLSLGLVASLAPAAAASNPVLLVPGLWYKYSPMVFGRRAFDPYRKWLAEAGIPPERIHVLDYWTFRDLPSINRSMARQLDAIAGQYPPETRFDVMGHSLGGFIALYAILTNGFSPRVERFVSLAGIPQGWDGMSVCRIGLCGEVHRLLIPYHAPFVLDLYRQYEEEIARLKKCSVFSRGDELVRPYDAGRFADGTNVELPQTSHMDTLFKRASFDAMWRGCYGR